MNREDCTGCFGYQVTDELPCGCSCHDEYELEQDLTSYEAIREGMAEDR